MSNFVIAMYVRAKNPDDLMREMIRNNASDGITYKYHSISYSNKFWYAWFTKDATKHFKTKLSELENGRTLPTEDN